MGVHTPALSDAAAVAASDLAGKPGALVVVVVAGASVVTGALDVVTREGAEVRRTEVGRGVGAGPRVGLAAPPEQPATAMATSSGQPR
jgi:hypothetical protein